MKLHDLHPTEGSRHRTKRLGRGDGSDKGGTSGRGEKGQKSRSGAALRPYFEGGQVPLFRRLPKRGFKSISHITYNVINTGTLESLFAANEEVSTETLVAKCVISKNKLPLKVLANGEITKPLKVKAQKFSESAKAKIEAAGGTCEIVK